MKKNTFLIISSLLISTLSNAQVLYSENFDNLTVGNVGTDLTGQTPGQGGLYTIANPAFFQNDAMQIKTEPNKGNVLNMKSFTTTGHWGCNIQKRDLDIPFNQRTQGNDLLKFQFDFYTGDIIQANTPRMNMIDFDIYSTEDFFLGGFRFYTDSKILYGTRPMTYSNARSECLIGKTYGTDLVLPPNQWVTVAVTIDFKNAKIYFEIPHLNLIHQFNSIPFTFSDPVAPDIPNTNGTPYKVILIAPPLKFLNQSQVANFKCDNFNATAINKAPTPTVSVNAFLNNKFTIYPNPATNMVTITNNEDTFIEQIKIYDMVGKLVKIQIFNNQKEIQLNIENLNKGAYLLHLETNKGTVVKNLLKN